MLHIYKKAEAIERLQNMPIEPVAEQNIFNHPAFLGPALDYFATNDCGLINFETPHTSFLLPFEITRAGLGFAKTICSWSNLYATQGTPLIRDHALTETLEAVIRSLRKPDHKLPDTLLLPDINLHAPFAKALHEVALSMSLPLQIIRKEERPVLCANEDAESYLTNAIGKNHRREYRRLWRRLSETGTLEYHIASDKTDISNAFERFLTLEAAGWKGKRGTAFLSKHLDADFARQAIRNLAEHNLVRIHMLMLDDRVIASLVVFIDGDQAWTWKTAYDESLKAFSPGVLLMIEVLKNHLENPALRITDSCAIPDHPVMSRLFHEREHFGTIILGLSDKSRASVGKITRQLNRYDRLRSALRTLTARVGQAKR